MILQKATLLIKRNHIVRNINILKKLTLVQNNTSELNRDDGDWSLLNSNLINENNDSFITNPENSTMKQDSFIQLGN